MPTSNRLLESMTSAQKWITSAGAVALLLVVLFPPWQQTYRGHPLAYKGEMGHHFRWAPPSPVGEQSWMVTAPASECRVVVKPGVVGTHCGMMLAMIAILLFAFRKQSAGQPRVTAVESSGPATILASLKARRLMLISLFLALCLPVPPPDGIPLGFFVVMSPVALFSDNGHLGP
jgi:hypothetical protein